MMGDTKDEVRVVQIRNVVLDRRNKKIPPVEAQGEDMIRTGGDFPGVCANG